MDFISKLNLANGLLNTIYDWRYLFVLFGFEIFILRYVFNKAKNISLALFVLIAIQIIHEILYLLNKVPAMHWFIPITDPFVKQTIHYQWIGYGVLFILVPLYFEVSQSRSFRKIFTSKTPPTPHQMGDASQPQRAGFLSPGERGLMLIPIFCIVAFVLSQQVFGYLSGYWLFQESDTLRYLEYGKILVERGFKDFTDIWMLGTYPAQKFELDMPLMPLIWGVVYKMLRWFIAAPRLADVTNHSVAISFWAISLWGTYLLGKELYNRHVGIYAALFLAFISYYSYIGYLYMIDVPLTAFVVLSLYCFIKAVKHDQNKYAFLAGLLFLLAFLTKYIALYTGWVILALFILFRRQNQWKPLVSFVTMTVSGTFIIAILLYYLYGDNWWQLLMGYIGHKRYVLKMHAFQQAQEYVALYHHGKLSFFFYFRYLSAYLGFGIIALMIVSLFSRDTVSSVNARERFLLIFWPFSLMLFFSLLSTKTTRFIFSGYPALAILAGHGFIKLREMSDNKRFVYLLLFLILTEMLGRHISFYYSDVAKTWIVGNHYEF